MRQVFNVKRIDDRTRLSLTGWFLVGVGMLTPITWGFNSPVDEVGPLTVRIDGPSKIAQTEKPIAIQVVLKNTGRTTVQGTVRVGVIDEWRAKPSKPVSFTVAGEAETKLDFVVIAGKGSYSALYPIHAWADFDVQGRKQRAHPILIVETDLPEIPRPRKPIDWKPVAVPRDGGLALWRLSTRRTIVHVFGEEPHVLPVGWSGTEKRTRMSVGYGVPMRRGQLRETIGIHPPWYHGHAGTGFVEFPVALPADADARLRFATAIRDHDPEKGEPPSDGVTFRVRVVDFDAPPGRAGKVVFERHSDAKVWQEAEVDLSEFAGRAVRLQLESHPGPKKNTTCDQSYWAEPTLIVGTPPPPPTFPPSADASSGELLGRIAGPTGEYEVRIRPGRRGLLDATVGFLRGDRRLYFHGFRVRVLGDALEDWRSPSTLLDVQTERADGRYRVRHRIGNWAGTFDLLGELWIETQGALRARFWLENTPPPRPWLVVSLEEVALGPWSESADRIYAGPGNVIEKPEAFTLSFDGHRLSTSFVGFEFPARMAIVEAVDVPPSRLKVDPSSRVYTLHTPNAQTRTLIPSDNVWQAVQTWRRINGLRPAGGVKKLAGRFVFDLWGGRYGPSADALRRAFRYDLTDSVVVWHNWQRWGYDYRLPDIYPPNPDLGTLEEFRGLADVCKEHAVLFAPHDNYIDLYPDAKGYSYTNISFHSDGRPIRAWLNRGRQAQAYRWRPDRIRPFVERNVQRIRAGVAPTAYFIDVWSSIHPHAFWTHDGKFFDGVFTRNTWGGIFAWIRDTLGENAPQISESGHDQLIGWLDGAQTNHLRVDTPPEGYYRWAVWNIRCDDAERIPWFDAAHHDRFILHGAGYEPRYASGLNPILHGIYSDDYITTEVLTGHPGMVSRPFGREVVRKYWLLADLMRSLALRHIESVEFVDGNLHRQKVRWDNGGEVWVNRGSEPWQVENRRLPQYGFYAKIPTGGGAVEATIERRNGVIVDWSSSPSMLYVNARPPVNGPHPVRVAAESVRFLDSRTFELSLRWEADRPLPEPLTVFVHFVNQQGKIQFQGDHTPPTPTTQWHGTVRTTARVRVPERFTPGQVFELRAGLFKPGGSRLFIEGLSDGTQRIRLGTVRLDGTNGKLTGVDFVPLKTGASPILARLNAGSKPITFDGGLTTNGACRLTRQDDHLLVTPLPDGPAFVLRLRWNALPWKLPEPKRAEVLDEKGTVLKRVRLKRENDVLLLTCEPGVFAYRLPPLIASK